MLIRKYDKKNRFKALFNTDTGFYVRTGVLDENGKDTEVDPFMTQFPELIDVGIMGHCIHGLTGKCKESGVECYQHGDICRNANMSFENYKLIVDECKGKTFQFALGGCGDPDMHENFEDILRYTRDAGIVPNFTTSGFGMTDKKIELCKQYCGAVAVSWYRSQYTTDTINKLVEAGVTTNIHFVLGNNSIDEALELIKTNGFPKGINAVVFLLHKPVGLGTEENVLKQDDSRVVEFFNLIDNGKFPFYIGFDSCTVPALINMTSNINPDTVETCEAARWSMYITPDMKALPCSFDNQKQKYAVEMISNSGEYIGIKNAWDSEKFEVIRNKFRNRCKGCKNHIGCLGGCPLIDNITLCNRDTRTV